MRAEENENIGHLWDHFFVFVVFLSLRMSRPQWASLLAIKLTRLWNIKKATKYNKFLQAVDLRRKQFSSISQCQKGEVSGADVRE